MELRLRVLNLDDVLPSEREFAEAAGRGVSNAVKRHLVDKDSSTPPRGDMPKTGYYGEAAGSVTTGMEGKIAVVSIPKEGMALHYYGGVVYPTDGHKALAIPQVAAVAGKRPAEVDPSRQKFALVWPKGKATGTLRDKESGEVVYLLVAKAKIPKDETVLPSEAEMYDAATAAMEAIL